MSAPGSASQAPLKGPAKEDSSELRLNWELEPWRTQFLDHLRSLFERSPDPGTLPFRPGIFWKDVFVDQSLNRRALVRSYAGHLAFAGLVYVLSMPFYWERLRGLEPATHDSIVYSNPAEDVLVTEMPTVAASQPAPPKVQVIRRSSRARVATSQDARQRSLPAMAVPKWADNREHLIVAPQAPKVIASAPIPDMVLAAPIAPAPPVASLAQAEAKLVAPALQVAPIAPPLDATELRSDLHAPALPSATPVQPPVDLAASRAIPKINIPLPDAVAPAPNISTLSSHEAVLSVAEPVAPPPDAKANSSNLARALPASVQPTAPATNLRASTVPVRRTVQESGEPAPQPPALNVPGSGSKAAAQILALNLTPVSGPPQQPDGNLRAAFAGDPAARTQATATPQRLAGGAGAGGDSPTQTRDELGIVAAATRSPAAGPSNTPSATGTGSTGAKPATLLALASPSRISLPPPKAPAVMDAPNSVDDRVFRGRKSYTMALNTPNLTSTAGSWIFRFAERGAPSKGGDVTAPEPLREVDPAYPADLVRDRVEGVVVLYAVITAEGNVSEVKVLEGFDDRLDENARRALSGWHFAPGTRNGNPVDLEAVVRIPFRTKRVF